MDTVKLIILLCCTYHSIASNSHTIPIGEYDSKLQDLGTHVEYPETPVKVIKITKTIAVKVPVPYPVKVIERVPYPVHVAKPYPVPVTQIVKVPQPHAPAHHHEGGAGGPAAADGHIQQDHGQPGGHYGPASDDGHGSDGHYSAQGDGDSYSGLGHGESLYGEDHSAGSQDNIYNHPANSYNGYSGNDGAIVETKSYDDALKEYLQKHGSAGGNVGGAPSDRYH